MLPLLANKDKYTNTISTGIARLERARVQGYQKGPSLLHTGFVWAPYSDEMAYIVSGGGVKLYSLTHPACTARFAHPIATPLNTSIFTIIIINE